MRPRAPRFIVVLRTLSLALAVVAPAPAAAQLAPQPETESGWQDRGLARAGKHMVVAAHPLAAQAGLDMLRRGGGAVDAAIAAQMVLNLVEPQSSGIGGGAFLLHWDAEARALATYDGRETAPRAARPDRFLRGGKPLDFRTAVRSGRSVGVPGLLRMLELAHARHGRLPWAELFQPAIALAERGFPVSSRLNVLLRWSGRDAFGPTARAYFFDDAGRPRAAGSRLANPDLAATFRLIAADGAAAFYQGHVARDIVAKVDAAPLSLRDLTLDDLARYEARERPATCVGYRVWEVCGMGPPSSGGLTVNMVLKLIEPFDLGLDPTYTDALHLIAEAQKLAYADRDRYMADDDFVSVPAGLLDGAYLAERRRLIGPNRAIDVAEPGAPPGLDRPPGRGEARESPGTSHLSIVDAFGDAVSMTTTIEGAFGSGLMVRGFLLNNQLTDFAFQPTDAAGRPVANRVEGGKRPRSSMAPTVVFEGDRDLRLVAGSPGGSHIILYVLKALIAHLDWGLDPQEATALGNFGSRNGPFEIEMGRAAPRLAVAMRLRGHAVDTRLMTSGLHIVAAGGGALFGGADPRRDGVALGD